MNSSVEVVVVVPKEASVGPFGEKLEGVLNGIEETRRDMLALPGEVNQLLVDVAVGSPTNVEATHDADSGVTEAMSSRFLADQSEVNSMASDSSPSTNACSICIRTAPRRSASIKCSTNAVASVNPRA